VIKEIDAKKLFMKLCKNNWDYAEPGILFWDNIKKHHLMSEDKEFDYAGVNPCAEEPLPSGGSCLLGSINLAE
ncbi:ribonucleoside-diphosphate reductase, adenosylcobalamin-dependent, partial [Casaltella massiliensis]|nr:ribonucleoside-diphosphate reductase, adenosylcobalamin-dependent [Casaltella massiliensis]